MVAYHLERQIENINIKINWKVLKISETVNITHTVSTCKLILWYPLRHTYTGADTFGHIICICVPSTQPMIVVMPAITYQALYTYMYM